MKPLALYPGSFDPVTRGHEDLIRHANEQYNLHIGVAVNPGKSPAFTLQERVRLLQKVVKEYGIDPLSVVRIPGSTARWMKRFAVPTIVRGKRNIIDELGEGELKYFNQLEYNDLETETLDANEVLQFASSSASKMLLRANHDPSSIITLDVQEALTSRILSQYPIYITGGMGAGKSTISRALEKEAQSVGIPTKYIELDTVAHGIYTSLDEPYYAGIRRELRAIFGDDISPDGNWLDRTILRKKLSDVSGKISLEQLAKLDAVMADAIEFRYRDMIEGFKGIILLDGIIKEGFSFSRFAHNNILMVDTDESIRIDRLLPRYERKGDPVTRDYVASVIASQPTHDEVVAIAKEQNTLEQHGSIGSVDGNDAFDVRKSFFQLLNQIDRYGELRATWILSKLGIQGNMREHLNYLQSKYNESHRYYHTWEHIVESLTTLFQMAIDLNLSDDDIEIIGGALLGHDLVYSVNEDYSENESNSAHMWSEYLRKNGVSPKKVNLISNLIEETRHGRVSVPERLISSVMHDVDMAILGSPWERYRIYQGDIPNEHRAIISGENFRTLRLEKFLLPVQSTGAMLYKTEWARERFSENLMRNIESEIAGVN